MGGRPDPVVWDEFAAGTIDRLPKGKKAQRLGWAHGALRTTYDSDVSVATLAEVEAFAKGGSARLRL